MQFKLNHQRRRHIPRQKHRVISSAAYDAALHQRGSLTVWFTEPAIKDWRAEPRTTPGGQPWYSPLAIVTALALRAAFRLALRQTEGLVGSVTGLLGLELRVPAHSTLSRPARTLEVPRLRQHRSGEPLHLLVDSTGLRLCGAGEWLLEKHGTKTRRAWRKLHIGLDAGTGQIVAASLTAREVDDGAEVGPLLDQVTGAVASFTDDGEYGQDRVRASVAELNSRDRAHPAGSPFAAHCRARPHRLAEGLLLHVSGASRGSNQPVQAGDWGRAAVAHGQLSSDRGGGRCRCAQPHEGAWTLELRPYYLTTDGVGVTAPAFQFCATRRRSLPTWHCVLTCLEQYTADILLKSIASERPRV